MILIGSRAMKYWYPKYKISENADWDIILEEGDPKIESHMTDCGRIEILKSEGLNDNKIRYLYSARLADVIHSHIYGKLNLSIIHPLGLAAIKRSHLHRPLKFLRHMRMYQELPHNFRQEDWDFINERKELTIKKYGDVVGTKNIPNDEFFKNTIFRPFPHDELHKIVADGEPLYLSIKKDKSKAAYDFDLWDACSHDRKVRIIQEECYVIGLERRLIPHKLEGRNFPYRMAFIHGAEKACTTLDNGPMRDFAIDNWLEIIQFRDKVFDKFFESDLWRNR